MEKREVPHGRCARTHTLAVDSSEREDNAARDEKAKKRASQHERDRRWETTRDGRSFFSLSSTRTHTGAHSAYTQRGIKAAHTEYARGGKAEEGVEGGRGKAKE